MKKEPEILTYEDATRRMPAWLLPSAAAAGALATLALIGAVIWVDGRAQNSLKALQARAVAQAENAAQQQDRAAATSRALQDLTERSLKLEAKVNDLAEQLQRLGRRDRAGEPPAPPAIAQLGDRVSIITAGAEVFVRPDPASEVIVRLSMNDRALVVGTQLVGTDSVWYRIALRGHPRFESGWISAREVRP